MRRFLLALTGLFWVYAGQGPELPNGVKVLNSVEGITEYQLENGLRVLLFPDASKPTVLVNITYLVGSRHEGYGETGMAHLLEHMVFKGTPDHPNIPQELTAHGAFPNGTTWFDRTNYFEIVQASDENLEWALDLEADRMVNSFIAKKDLDTEMTVVRNEFEMGENNPQAILEERTLSTAYLWHNYGKSTIGARSDLEQVPIERLQAFYRKYYQPDNAVLLVAGRIEVAKTLNLILKHFGPIPKPERELVPTYTLDPTQDGERFVTLRRVGDVQALQAIYHGPAAAHPDSAACEVLSRILNETPGGRLHKALVETQLATEVSANFMDLREPGYFSVSATLRTDQSLESAQTAMLQTLEHLSQNPVTEAEVQKAINAFSKSFELSMNTVERFGINLSEYIAKGDWRLLFLNRDRIQAVKPEDVNRVAGLYLKPANRTLGQFIPTANPDRTEVPQSPDLAALLKDYHGREAVAQGEAFDPSPENIAKRTQIHTLSNGLQVALLAKNTRGGSVQLNLALAYGSLDNLKNMDIPAELCGAMLMRGTQNYSREALKSELDKIKTQIRISSRGTQQLDVSVETNAENLSAALDLLGEILMRPSFPENEFTLLKNETLAELEVQKNEPMQLGFRLIQTVLFPYPVGDVRHTLTYEEQIKGTEQAQLPEVKSFYQKFLGANHGQLAVIGQIDAQTLLPLLESKLGAWQSQSEFDQIVLDGNAYSPTEKVIMTPDKANAMFTAGACLALTENDADYEALVLGNYIFGGGFLNSRLATRIRQKEGLSYGVGSMIFYENPNTVSQFMVYAIAAPQNVEKVHLAFKDELERMLKDGFTQSELDDAKKGYLQQMQGFRSQDGMLARIWVGLLKKGKTMAWQQKLIQKIEALTLDEVNQAMRRYIEPEKISIVKAGDFKQKETTTPAE